MQNYINKLIFHNGRLRRYLKFDPALFDLIESGVKTQTIRMEKSDFRKTHQSCRFGKVGDIIIAVNAQDELKKIEIQIKSIHLNKLNSATLYDIEKEGFKSFKEFKNFFEERYLLGIFEENPNVLFILFNKLEKNE